jgi:programmed cell death protein 5
LSRYIDYLAVLLDLTNMRRSVAHASNSYVSKAVPLAAAVVAAAEAKVQTKMRKGTVVQPRRSLYLSKLTYINRQREADQRNSILVQILTPEAADRLGRIRLVKESRATDVENRLIMLARSGQLRAKVTEEQLKELLGAVAEQQEKEESKIVVNRRGGGGWDDDDLDDLLEGV